MTALAPDRLEAVVVLVNQLLDDELRGLEGWGLEAAAAAAAVAAATAAVAGGAAVGDVTGAACDGVAEVVC